MIRWLRRKSNQRRLFLGLAILIIPSFVLWGVSLDTSDTPKSAGSLGSRNISTNEFIKNYEALRRELQLFHGINIQEASPYLDFERLTWQRIILIHEAEQKKIRITDRDVVEWLRSQEIFQVKGQFDPEFYRRIVTEYLRMDPRRFEEDVRDMIALQKIQSVLRENVQVSQAAVREFFRMRYSPRDLEYIIFTEKDLDEIPEITEEELLRYFEWVKPRLIQPEKVKVRYVTRKTPGEEDSASELLEKKGTTTPFFTRKDPIPEVGFSEELTTEIFALKKTGEKTPWLSHENHEILFQLVEIEPERPMTFEDAKSMLEEELTEQMKRKAIADLARKTQEAMLDYSFETVAQETGKKVYDQTNFSSEDYLDKVGQLPEVAQVRYI